MSLPPIDPVKRAFTNGPSYIKPDFVYVSTRELDETIQKVKRPEDKLKYQLLTPTITEVPMVYQHTLNSNGKREVKKAAPRKD